jgi:DNA-binding CsgD family transcriptional regulator/PAS domain-containing protein
MRPFEQRLSDLLLDVYEAAANPQHWATFLENAARELDASKAALHVHYFASGNTTRTAEGGCAVAIGYDAASLAAYANHYATQDIYVQRIRERFSLGLNAGTSEELVTSSELRGTEIYQDYCRTNEVFHTCWSAFEQTKGIAAGLGFIRPENARPFKAKDVDLLKLLNPHLAKAFRLQRILESAADNNSALLTGIAQFDFGVIALDREHRITNLSTPAKQLLDQKDGILIQASHLEAITPAENRRLQEMLNTTNQIWENPHQSPCNTLLLSRKSGKKPLQLVVFPFVSSGLLGEDRPQTLVFLSDPSSKPASRAAVLRALYGLTPTESRLADFLLQGFEVREAADHLRNTLETTRFHLKRVLAKTGARRQSELMRLMLSLPGE